VWPGVYGAGSSLQHAAQLQLLSQQQMLRQQELLMIQQHTAQVLELQRNAQLVVSGVVFKCTRIEENYVIQTPVFHNIYIPVRVCVRRRTQTDVKRGVPAAAGDFYGRNITNTPHISNKHTHILERSGELEERQMISLTHINPFHEELPQYYHK